MSEPSTTVSAIWTDFGGVLTPPISHTMGVFCARFGLDPAAVGSAVATVTARYGTRDMMEPLDTPLVSEPEWLRQVEEVLAEQSGVVLELDTLADVWFDGRELDHAWFTALTEYAARGLFVGMVSNMVPAWDSHWRAMLPDRDVFRDVVLSFEVGHRKPSRALFDLAAERAGVEPARCVLVDDLEQNCDGARAAGWQAVLYRDAVSAAADLDALLPADRRVSPVLAERSVPEGARS